MAFSSMAVGSLAMDSLVSDVSSVVSTAGGLEGVVRDSVD